MVPPWTPDPAAPAAAPAAGGGGDDPGSPDGAPATAPGAPAPALPAPVPIAPAGRFMGARLNLGKFAGSGDKREMRRGVGHYAQKGLGGAATAARRMGGASVTAGGLYNALTALASGNTAAEGRLDRNVLQGTTAGQVIAAIVEAVSPVDGTQDAEASRDAIQDSLSQLLTDFPDADLLSLTNEQRWLVVEGYLACDIYNRIMLDVGKTIQEKAPTSTVALQRLKDVKDYVRETVSARLNKLHAKGTEVTQKRMGEIIRATVTETFEVFESYAE